MLSRIYIDNYRAFVKFEHTFGPTQLLLGENGSGKSSLFDAIWRLRGLLRGLSPDELKIYTQRTRWLRQSRQTFEVDAILDGGIFHYQVEIDAQDGASAGIAKESLFLDNQPLYEFVDETLTLYDGEFQRLRESRHNNRRSLLSSVSESENRHIARFLHWCGGIHLFRINPFNMTQRSLIEEGHSQVDMSNFSSWYRHLVQEEGSMEELRKSLTEAMPGFVRLQVVKLEMDSRTVVAVFQGPSGEVLFGLEQLSEGQRCLIALYTISHYVVGKGFTVLLDEPDNFVALRELQPWLMQVSTLAEDARGQVIILSHHPEIINQWAVECGFKLDREKAGAIQVRPFQMDFEIGLTPAELVYADGMMPSRPSQVIVLVEDQRTRGFVWRYLTRCLKFSGHQIDVRPLIGALGAGDSSVLRRSAEVVKALRQRQHTAKTVAIIVIDADSHSVDQRLAQLSKTLEVPLKPDEPVAHLVPKRSIETWILCLNGEAVDEETRYKKSKEQNRVDDVASAVAMLHAWTRGNATPPESCLPSLRHGCQEIRKFER